MTSPDVQEAIEVLDTATKTAGTTHAMLTMPGVVEALAVVGCDIGARPEGAPMFEDVKPYILAVRRAPGRLSVDFDARAVERVAAFVAAEQTCCSDLAYTLVPGDPTVIHISATSEVIDVLEDG